MGHANSRREFLRASDTRSRNGDTLGKWSKVFGMTGLVSTNFAPVSVIIPCYRATLTIDRAITSVARQSLRPIEIIFVDDGSGDATVDMLYAIQGRYGGDWIKVIPLPVNGGPSVARNIGWGTRSSR